MARASRLTATVRLSNCTGSTRAVANVDAGDATLDGDAAVVSEVPLLLGHREALPDLELDVVVVRGGTGVEAVVGVGPKADLGRTTRDNPVLAWRSIAGEGENLAATRERLRNAQAKGFVAEGVDSA